MENFKSEHVLCFSKYASQYMESRALYRSLAIVGLVVMPMTAERAYANIDDEKSIDDIFSVEEIVVTARKREERLIDTPVAVTAMSASELSRRNYKDLSNVARQVPNMTFDLGTGSTGSSNNAQIFIRGVGQQDYLFTSDPGVGLYVDGVYFPRGTGVVMDLVDLEQVEVLRGPQGTLFGKNTIGGAIIVTSKKPGEEQALTFNSVVGSRNRIDAQLAVNFPLIKDKLSMKFSGSTRNQDGYVERILAGDDLGNTKSLYGRLQFRWTPSENTRIDLSADVTRKRESSAAEELIEIHADDPSNAILGLWNIFVAPTLGEGVRMDDRFLSGEYQTQATGPNFSNFDMFGVSLTIERDINDSLIFKSITAYREQDSQFAGDTDHSPFRYLESDNDNEHQQFSQEFQLTGDSFDSRLNWVFGGFYMKEKGADKFNGALGSGLFNSLEALPAAIIPLGLGFTCPPPMGVFLPCVGGPGNPLNVSFDLDILISDKIDIESYALFGEASLDVNDRLSATVGLRYSHDKKVFVTSLTRLTAGIVTVPETEQSESWNDFSPRFGLKYSLRDDAMVYASVTRGFKSGGFNGRVLSPAEFTVFDPEKVWAYEVGMKASFAENRFGLNLSAFYNDYQNMQLLSVRDVGGLVVAVTENAGVVEIKGLELEFFAVPVSGLNFRGGLGYIDANYKELAPGATVSLADRLVNTPEWTANAALDYTITLGNSGSLTFGGDIAYRSSYVNELTNAPSLNQDGFALFGAFIQYREPNDNWSVTAFGINLGNKRYKTNGLATFGSFGNAVANFAPPREWGLKFNANF